MKREEFIKEIKSRGFQNTILWGFPTVQWVKQISKNTCIWISCDKRRVMIDNSSVRKSPEEILYSDLTIEMLDEMLKEVIRAKRQRKTHTDREAGKERL